MTVQEHHELSSCFSFRLIQVGPYHCYLQCFSDNMHHILNNYHTDTWNIICKSMSSSFAYFLVYVASGSKKYLYEIFFCY